MDRVLVESTTSVCVFGLGIAITALALYKGGSFIERKLDEADRLESEVKEVERREESPSRAFKRSKGA